MERISINTLIKNAKSQRVSRTKYLANITNQMLYMPAEHLANRNRSPNGNITLSYEDLDAILEHLDIPVKDSKNLRFMDLVFYIAKCLESDDEMAQKKALDTADHFFMLARDIDNHRAERRLK